MSDLKKACSCLSSISWLRSFRLSRSSSFGPGSTKFDQLHLMQPHNKLMYYRQIQPDDRFLFSNSRDIVISPSEAQPAPSRVQGFMLHDVILYSILTPNKLGLLASVERNVPHYLVRKQQGKLRSWRYSTPMGSSTLRSYMSA